MLNAGVVIVFVTFLLPLNFNLFRTIRSTIAVRISLRSPQSWRAFVDAARPARSWRRQMREPVHARVPRQPRGHPEPERSCDRAPPLDGPSTCRDTVRRESPQICSRLPTLRRRYRRSTRPVPPVRSESPWPPLLRNPDSRPASCRTCRDPARCALWHRDIRPLFPLVEILHGRKRRQCACSFPLSKLRLRGLDHVAGAESEFLLQHFQRCRSAECLHSENHSVQARVPSPSQCGGLLDGDA